MNEINFQTRTLLSNFTILNISVYIQESSLFQKREIDQLLIEIDQYQKYTGIMIGDFEIIHDIYVFFYIMDYHVIIIDQKSHSLFKNFFEFKCYNVPIFFTNAECEKRIKSNNIKENIEANTQINYLNANIKKKTKIQNDIEKEICISIIKKSQNRTLIRYQRSKFDSNKKETVTTFNLDDFIFINNISTKINLYFNTKDQFLYILKRFYDCDLLFNHEITFYKEIENKHPFISRYFGKIETDEAKYIIIEYIEGETLDKFITKKRLSINFKTRIIFELIITVEYIHSKNIILRDLKPDNILIDSNGNMILIDFDRSKQIQKRDLIEEMTSDIGSLIYSAPEQNSSNKYSQKVDIYSLGLIIHFIITELMIAPINHYIYMFRRVPSEYEKLYDIYADFLSINVESRPSVDQIINSLLTYIRDFLENNKNKENSLLCREFIEYLTYLSDSKNSSYAQYLLGSIYYFHKLIHFDIDKSIYYFTHQNKMINMHKHILAIFIIQDTMWLLI